MQGRGSFWFWILPPVIAIGLVIGIWAWRRRAEEAPPLSPSASELPEVPPRPEPPMPPPDPLAPTPPNPGAASIPEGPSTPAGPESVSLAELAASPGAVAAGLSDHPLWARWLAEQGVVTAFVRAVDAVAHGLSPREQITFWNPGAPFGVRRSDVGSVPSEAACQRYNPVVALAVSLDSAGFADVYRQVEPALDEAYADLGYSDRRFRDALRKAADVILAAPIPSRPPALVQSNGVWYYRDPALEGLNDAQKHLLRMGPANARKLQVKTRALMRAIDAD